MASMCEINNKQLELTFPTQWEYKLIAPVDVDVKEEVKDILADKEHTISASNVSKEGKYQSHSAKVTVNSHEERKELFEKLKAKPNIKYVL